jgi:hypothetical protein
VWDVTARQVAFTFNEHKDQVRFLRLLPLSSHARNVFQVWGLSFDDKGDKLVSVGDDRSLIRYDVQ